MREDGEKCERMVTDAGGGEKCERMVRNAGGW